MDSGVGTARPQPSLPPTSGPSWPQILGPTLFVAVLARARGRGGDRAGQGTRLLTGEAGLPRAEWRKRGGKVTGTLYPVRGDVVKALRVCPSQREGALGPCPLQSGQASLGPGQPLLKPQVWSERSRNWRACPSARNNKLTIRKDLFLKKVELCTMRWSLGIL